MFKATEGPFGSKQVSFIQYSGWGWDSNSWTWRNFRRSSGGSYVPFYTLWVPAYGPRAFWRITPEPSMSSRHPSSAPSLAWIPISRWVTLVSLHLLPCLLLFSPLFTLLQPHLLEFLWTHLPDPMTGVPPPWSVLHPDCSMIYSLSFSGFGRKATFVSASTPELLISHLPLTPCPQPTSLSLLHVPPFSLKSLFTFYCHQ